MHQNTTVRGGGGICPVGGHSKLGKLDVAELAGLGKASEGKKRELTRIPDGFRLENTGVRFELTATTGGQEEENKREQFRGFVVSASAADGTTNAKQDLVKRNEPSWNGLHVSLGDADVLVVTIQRRSVQVSADGEKQQQVASAWRDVVSRVTIEPLSAFTVEDQDVVWHGTTTKADIGAGRVNECTVWVELSLQRLSSNILEQSRGTRVAAKFRAHKKYTFEPGKRDPDELVEDAALLQTLLDDPDPTTAQDRVHMKHIWNKCLGWIDLTGEFFVETLFLRCPDLLSIFGDIPAELAFDMFVSLIDKSVRALDDRTEVIARESYRVIPLSRPIDAPFDTLEEGFRQFAQLGMRPRHWKEARPLFLNAVKNANPYIEEPDVEVLNLGTDSCAYRFYTWGILKPALLAIQELDEIFDSEKNREILQSSFAPLAEDKVRSGTLFYQNLFTTRPDVIPYFGTTDMDFLAGHLFEAIELLTEVVNDFETALPVLRRLGKIHDNHGIPVFTYDAIGQCLDATLRKTMPLYGDGTPEGEHLVKLWSALLNRTVLVTNRISFVSERLLRHAFEWVEQVAHELKWDEAYLTKRKLDIEAEVRTKGTYAHTEEEVVHGARVAWRNSAKCVGRIAWNTLMVRDRRHITDLDHMFAECLEHQRLATADGSLKAVMTVFRPRQPGTRMGMRFWNLQLVRFACYELPDGTLIGDRANKTYTDECIAFGWKPPEPRGEFDVLPLVLEDPIKGVTKMFELPKEYHKVTMIEHPKYPEFAKLGLRWCVVPTVTCFTLKLGGLQYTCCPFNGWFMECEITRDLLEPGRMDKMVPIARAIGVDPEDEDDFWRERVALETNKAVMYSFRKDGHSIVDHVTAQGQFLAHDQREKREGRECPAQWSWVVPSFGGSTMPIWHHEMRDFYIEPQYLYQAEIYAVRKEAGVTEEELVATDDQGIEFEKLLIVYASVTGTAESYAFKAKKALRPLQVTVTSCDKVDPKELWSLCQSGGGAYAAVLFIVSTFGEGDPPANAEAFFKVLKSLPISALADVPYSVMAIGSRIYPDFCQAGIDLDRALGKAGGKQILPLKKADQVNGQEESVDQWITSIGSLFDVEQKRALLAAGDAGVTLEDEGPPVTIELLSGDDERVKSAIAEEKELVSDYCAGPTARFLPDGFRLCAVTRNSELVDRPDEEAMKMFKSTRFLEFNLEGVSKDASSPPLRYETGDHARIMPVNDSEVVADMCRCLQLMPDQWVEVDVKEGRSCPVSVMRVGDLLSLEIDLATQDDNGNLPLLSRLVEIARSEDSDNAIAEEELSRLEVMLESLTDAADVAMAEAKVEKVSEVEKRQRKRRSSILDVGGVGGVGNLSDLTQQRAELEEKYDEHTKLHVVDAPSAALSREEGRKQVIAAIIEKYVTIPELLQQFPQTALKLSLADCVETLPRLKPRHYSIASSSEMHPTELQLTVGVLTVTHKSTQKKRQGVCSHYLSKATTHDMAEPRDGIMCSGATNFVRLGLSRSSFRLPQDPAAPVIMVGPGTGISPMLGFLQAREKALADGIAIGPCMVFFGCRAENDFLHSKQMRQWVDAGVITDLQVAFSRLPGHPKEYVQHRIGKLRRSIWEVLSKPDCHYYVCGDSQMAEDVLGELQTTVAACGGFDHYDTKQFFAKMKKERRYQTDTWGVVEKRAENLKKLTEKKYNQGAAWLSQVEKEQQEISRHLNI